MNSKQIEALKETIENNESRYNFSDCIYKYLDGDRLEQIESVEELSKYLKEIDEDNEITNMQIIYCDEAINFLAENDASLKESLDIAQSLGCNIDDINSELLASLLATRINEEYYDNFVTEVINDMEKYF